MSDVVVGGPDLTLEDVAAVARGAKVGLFAEARTRMERSRAPIEAAARGGGAAVYGVNTGFGALSRVRIDATQVKELQLNLIRSHAAGVGPDHGTDVVRAMLLCRAHTLALGHSGVRPVVVETLLQMLNRGVHPVVPSRGSVGASGDLAPLAHLALTLVGEGEAEFSGERMPAARALSAAGIAALELLAKEGLSLVNGTQAMTAQGTLALLLGESLCASADVTGAMTLEAVMGSPRAFDERIHALRPHPGQIASASALARLLQGSEIARAHADCDKVQDAYSLRCMPQVHGAARDALSYTRAVLAREVQSVTDNPLVFEDGTILSGGNFHGQPVAIALDLAAIALCDLGSIAERRIEQLVNPAFSGLPPFLAPREGLHSGFMIAQVTAAALVAECRILAHPASVDSIPSSAGKEDHVSMGAHAAAKLARVADNVATILGIEAMCAAQGLDLRRPLQPAAGVLAAHQALRRRIGTLQADRPLSPDIAAAADLVRTGALRDAASSAVGGLS